MSCKLFLYSKIIYTTLEHKDMSVKNDEKNQVRDYPCATELAFISESFNIDSQELQYESKKNHSNDESFFLIGDNNADYTAYDFSEKQIDELQLINSIIEDESKKSTKIWNKFENENKETIWDIKKTHDPSKHENNMLNTVELKNKKKNLYDVADKPINAGKLHVTSISPKRNKKTTQDNDYELAFDGYIINSNSDLLLLLEQMKIYGKILYEIINKKNPNYESKQTTMKNLNNTSFNLKKPNVDDISVKTNNKAKIRRILPQDISSSKRQKTSINCCNFHNPTCVEYYKNNGLCQFCFKILTFMDLFDINHNKDHFKFKTKHLKLAKYCRSLCTNLFYMLNHLETPGSMQNITVFMNFKRKIKIKSSEMYRKLAYEEFTLSLKKITDNENDTIKNDSRTFKINYQNWENNKHIDCLSNITSQFVKLLYFDIKSCIIMNRLHYDSATKSQDIINRRNMIIQNFVFIIDDLLYNDKVEIIIDNDLYFRWRNNAKGSFCEPKTFLQFTMWLGFKINYCGRLCEFFDFMSKIFTDIDFHNKINVKDQSSIGSKFAKNCLNKEVVCDKSDIFDEKMYQSYLSELFRYKHSVGCVNK